MSAREHRRHAEEHDRRAAGHDGQPDAAARATGPRVFSFPSVPNINAESTEVADIAPNPPGCYRPPCAKCAL